MQTDRLRHPAGLFCSCFGADGAGRDSGLPEGSPPPRFQDDLFRATNAEWLSTSQVPPDKPRFSTFIQLRDLTEQQVREIVESLAHSPQAYSAASVEGQVGAFYRAYLDTGRIDALGFGPLDGLFAEIDAIESPHDLARWFGSRQGQLDTPVSLYVMPDFKEPGTYRPLTWQGGLGMPNRDYYLNESDPRIGQARSAYSTYLTTLATLCGIDNPTASAQRVLELERRIAALHWTPVDNRDSLKLYNPMALDRLSASAPGLDWRAFLEAAGLSHIDRLTVSQPSAVTGIAKLFCEIPIDDWKLYARLHFLDHACSVLPRPYREAQFAFRGTALSGATSEKPRWQAGIEGLNRALGDEVGQLYVARHFSALHGVRLERLVANLMAAYSESIEELTWLTPATKAEAQRKLASFTTKIGQPESWRDISGLVMIPSDAFGNVERAAAFEWQRQAARACGPVDRTEWTMTPQTVNAHYNPSMNEIVFPAAILQPPLFDPQADDAYNYGAIGAVIGHEISHGFDDQGSRFDGAGMLRDWWSAGDRRAFEAIGSRLVAQYEAYELSPGQRLNGRLTLGENMADVAGLQVAYKAYRRSLSEDLPVPECGTIGAQRFFIGWARVWRDLVREEHTLLLLMTDQHSPACLRANGAAVNHDGFHDAFQTRPGDGMFRAIGERIRVW
ncbi:MAG: M13 family metallopeptidase [Burkholderiaceae bacterium]